MNKIDEIINIVVEDIRKDLCVFEYKRAKELSNILASCGNI